MRESRFSPRGSKTMQICEESEIDWDDKDCVGDGDNGEMEWVNESRKETTWHRPG
jgi:hypothetical protein